MKWRTVALLLVVPAVLALGACQVTLGSLSVTWDEPLADPQPVRRVRRAVVRRYAIS